MAILSKADIEIIAPSCREWYMGRVIRISSETNVSRVGDLVDTINAMRVALEAWTKWHTSDNVGPTSVEDELVEFDNAVRLTKAAGIECPE